MKQMTLKRRYLKVSDVLDAMEKDGYKKARGTFFRSAKREEISWNDRNQVVYACAIGQAALNLNIDPALLQHHLGLKLSESIIDLNDDSGRSVRSIAKYLKKELGPLILDRMIDIMIDDPEQEAVAL